MKKRRVKQVFAAVLSACMIFGTMGGTSFAQNRSDDSTQFEWVTFSEGRQIARDAMMEQVVQSNRLVRLLNPELVSEYGIMSQVMEETGYYSAQLSGIGKRMYDILVSKIDASKSGTTTFDLDVSKEDNTTLDKFMKDYYLAIDAFVSEHPEVFWIDWGKTMIGYERTPSTDILTKVSIVHNPALANYYPSATREMANGSTVTYYGGATPFTSINDVNTAISNIEATAEKCMALVNKCTTDYDKIKAIHDWLCEKIEYSLDYYAQDMYSAMTYGKGVCAGYVTSFQYLMKKAGITSIPVSGVGYSDAYNSESHAWNLVNLDEKWYGMDVTWDDQKTGNEGNIFYDFFLSGSDTVPEHFYKAKFQVTHVLNSYVNYQEAVFTIPKITANSYDSGSNPTPTLPPNTPIKLGDADENGKLDLADAQKVLKIALGIIQISNIKYADADKNGRVDLADAQLVLKSALGIITLS